MRKFVFNKLIRNDILASMHAQGANAAYRVLSHDGYIAALKTKIIEEAAEINLDDPSEIIKELADVQEVIDCLIVAIGKSPADIKAAQTKKTARFGSFDQKIHIDSVEVQDDSEWINHYLTDPKRYPEII